MKKICFLMMMLLFSVAMVDTGSNQLCAKTKLEKLRSKQYKAKIKELKKEGWHLDSSSKSLEVELLEHYEQLKDNNNQEIVGVSKGKSTNVMRQVAFNNAVNYYAGQAASLVKGLVTSDVFSDGSDESAITEFDKFYSAYERLVCAEIKEGTIKESFSVKRKSGEIYEYQTYFIMNEDKALQARKRAMQRAFEETKMAQRYADMVSKFVNEAFSTDLSSSAER